MLELYPRLGNYTLSELKTVDNEIWDTLSDDEKDQYCNVGQQELANFLAQNGLKDYSVATVDINVDIFSFALVYAAYITQSGTGAPTAIIGYNNTGQTPTWTRVSAGVFRATTNNLFTSGKTFIEADDDSVLVGTEWTYRLTRIDVNIVELRVYDVVNELTDNFANLRVIFTIYL